MAMVKMLLAFFLATLAMAQFDSESKAKDAVLQASEVLVQQLGWKKEDVRLVDINSKDIRFGEALIYEFDIDVGGTILPIKLSEDISKWRYLPKTQNEQQQHEIVNIPPFQLAGPVELWIQDAKQLRLSLPNDVDAGVLKKVFLADGTNVTVTGAREVSLARPLKLPLIREQSGSLKPLSNKLKYASRMSDKPLLSLRIVGPTSMSSEQTTSSEGTSSTSSNKLKVKRVSPGAVELVNRNPETQIAEIDPEGKSDFLWPLPLINASNPKVQVLEQFLEQTLNVVLGDRASEQHSFNLLRARASASSLAKVEFVIEKQIDNATLAMWPDWATKPTVHRYRFETTLKLEENGHQVLGITPLDSSAPLPPPVEFPLQLHGNRSFTQVDQNLPPLSPLTI